jgi:hypothetical protein
VEAKLGSLMTRAMSLSVKPAEASTRWNSIC